MKIRLKLLGTTALAAAALVLGAPTASADKNSSLEKRVMALEKAGGMSVSRAKKTMKLVVNGHINRAITFADNGTTSGFSHITQNFSQTRVRWIGTGKINDDLSVMTYIELGNASAATQAIGAADNNAVAALGERFLEFRVTSKSLGKIYMGQGAGGTDGTSESDLSGTGILSLNGAGTLVGGGESFQVAGAAAGGTVAQSFNSLDGDGRRDRIRYDSPKFSGFQITASHANSDVGSVALRYGGKLGGVSVKAAIAYTDLSSAGGNEITNGSVAILLPMGVSFAIGAGTQDNDRFGGHDDDVEWRYAKIGYKFKGWGSGETRLFIDYSDNEHANAANDDSEYWGMGVVQVVEPLGAELYAGYRNFTLDRQDAADPDDVDVVVAGMRFSF